MTASTFCQCQDVSKSLGIFWLSCFLFLIQNVEYRFSFVCVCVGKMLLSLELQSWKKDAFQNISVSVEKTMLENELFRIPPKNVANRTHTEINKGEERKRKRGREKAHRDRYTDLFR